MKQCPCCGKQLLDQAVACPKCGCSDFDGNGVKIVTGKPIRESSGTMSCAILFTLLFPIVGLIYSVAGVVCYQTNRYKSVCAVCLVLNIFIILGALALLFIL